MANDVIFNKGQGALGRPLAGTDYISGSLFYTASLPSGFTATNRIKTVYSIEDAIALGITNTSIGETKSTATYLVTNKGASGDTHKLTCAIIDSVNPTANKAALGTVTLKLLAVTGTSKVTEPPEEDCNLIGIRLQSPLE